MGRMESKEDIKTRALLRLRIILKLTQEGATCTNFWSGQWKNTNMSKLLVLVLLVGLVLCCQAGNLRRKLRLGKSLFAFVPVFAPRLIQY